MVQRNDPDRPVRRRADERRRFRGARRRDQFRDRAGARRSRDARRRQQRRRSLEQRDPQGRPAADRERNLCGAPGHSRDDDDARSQQPRDRARASVRARGRQPVALGIRAVRQHPALQRAENARAERSRDRGRRRCRRGARRRGLVLHPRPDDRPAAGQDRRRLSARRNSGAGARRLQLGRPDRQASRCSPTPCRSARWPTRRSGTATSTPASSRASCPRTSRSWPRPPRRPTAAMPGASARSCSRRAIPFRQTCANSARRPTTSRRSPPPSVRAAATPRRTTATSCASCWRPRTAANGCSRCASSSPPTPRSRRSSLCRTRANTFRSTRAAPTA